MRNALNEFINLFTSWSVCVSPASQQRAHPEARSSSSNLIIATRERRDCLRQLTASQAKCVRVRVQGCASVAVNVTKELTVASGAASYFQLDGNVHALIYRCQEQTNTHRRARVRAHTNSSCCRPHFSPCPLSPAKWAFSLPVGQQ